MKKVFLCNYTTRSVEKWPMSEKYRYRMERVQGFRSVLSSRLGALNDFRMINFFTRSKFQHLTYVRVCFKYESTAIYTKPIMYSGTHIWNRLFINTWSRVLRLWMEDARQGVVLQLCVSHGLETFVKTRVNHGFHKRRGISWPTERFLGPQIYVLFFLNFEVLTAVIIESIFSWDVTPCSLVEVIDVSEERTASIFRVE
jgi:hypothetical protein